jgi:hypothetical protein
MRRNGAPTARPAWRSGPTTSTTSTRTWNPGRSMASLRCARLRSAHLLAHLLRCSEAAAALRRGSMGGVHPHTTMVCCACRARGRSMPSCPGSAQVCQLHGTVATIARQSHTLLQRNMGCTSPHCLCPGTIAPRSQSANARRSLCGSGGRGAGLGLGGAPASGTLLLRCVLGFLL